MGGPDHRSSGARWSAPRVRADACLTCEETAGILAPHNVHDASFKEIWFSTRHREAIESIVSKECQHCDCPMVRYLQVPRDYISNQRLNHVFR